MVASALVLGLEGQLASLCALLQLRSEDSPPRNGVGADQPLEDLPALDEDGSELLVDVPRNLRLALYGVDVDLALLLEVHLEEVGGQLRLAALVQVGPSVARGQGGQHGKIRIADSRLGQAKSTQKW
jgi:hypothetical protein